MTQLTDAQVATVCRRAGFTGERLVDAITVCLAESDGRTDAVNTAGNHPPSRDRGLFEINDHYHPEVSDRCAFDADCNAHAAYRISEGGRNWSQWSTWQHRLSNPRWPALERRARAAATRPPFTLHRYLRAGVSGTDVAELQHRLGIVADGVFGPITADHVREWQRGHRLTPDGIVGENTAHSLGWIWAG